MKALATCAAHTALGALNAGAYRCFLAATATPEATQRQRLEQLLRLAAATTFGRRHRLAPGLAYEEVMARLPLSTYADLAPLVEAQRAGGTAEVSRGVRRYQPTSGSTSARKWIPYAPAFLAELDAASAPWLFDMARRFPGVRRGRHYWSLSWLPEDLRRERQGSDDGDLFPWWKRQAMRRLFIADPALAHAATAEAAGFATVTALAAATDLTLLSVWSPSFALELFARLGTWREEIAACLLRGSWGPRAASLPPTLPCPKAPRVAALLREWDGTLRPEVFAGLWPRLALISAWSSSHSAAFAAELTRLLPHAAFQGKGLWATEGVVTIPLAGQYPLAVRSHVYEFRCLATDRLLPAWRLEAGQEVQPILSTGSGFWRYPLGDRLRVTGFLGRCPTLEFLGRLGGVDLVGEKLDADFAAQVLGRVTGARGLCLFAVHGPRQRPHYVLLADGPAAVGPALAAQGEAALGASHHYRLARELGQLDPVKAVVRPDALAYYLTCAERRGMVRGEVKLEPVAVWDLPEAPGS